MNPKAVLLQSVGLRALYFFGTALILCAPALFNRYPLVYFDTGSYLFASFNLEPFFDRPVGYSLFIRAVTWQATTWTVVIAQGLLLSYLLFRTLQISLQTNRIYFAHLAIVTMLTLVSSVGWYAAQLMPDIFTSCMVLAVYILLMKKPLHWLEGLFLCSIIWISVVSHFSNIGIAILLLAFGGVLLLKKSSVLENRLLFIQRSGVLSATLAGGMLFLMSFHYAHDKGFKLTLSSNVFLVAAFCENGMLTRYLDEQCPEADLSLCAYKESIPRESFLWDKESPFEKTGRDWAKANEEYAKITTDVLTTPRYLSIFLWDWGKATFKQLFQVKIGSGMQAYSDTSPPYWPIHRQLKHEENEFLTSNQNQGQLDFAIINIINYFALAFSLLVVAFALYFKKLDLSKRMLVMLCLYGILFNAFITGLYNVYDRLQARVTWLLVLAAIVCLISTWPSLKRILRVREREES